MKNMFNLQSQIQWFAVCWLYGEIKTIIRAVAIVLLLKQGWLYVCSMTIQTLWD